MFRSNIYNMKGYVSGEQPAAGERILKLNTNENPYACSPHVLEAIHNSSETGLSTYPDPNATAFREKASEVLGVTPEMILCGNGSDEILTILIRAFVGEGDTIRFPFPTYILYRTLADIQGACTDEVLFESDWSLGQNFTAPLERLKLAFLANPNSPSGSLQSPEQVEKLASALPCPLVVDEAYADFAIANCLSLVSENKNILVTRTLSKSYALAGLRFGFVVAQPHIIEQLAKVKDSYNCDAISIAAATAAMDDQAWLNDNRAKILQTRTRLANRLVELGFQTTPTQANFVWATRNDRPVRAIYEQLKLQGVLVRYLDYTNWGDGLRISVGTDSQIDEFLTKLEGVLDL